VALPGEIIIRASTAFDTDNCTDAAERHGDGVDRDGR